MGVTTSSIRTLVRSRTRRLSDLTETVVLRIEPTTPRRGTRVSGKVSECARVRCSPAEGENAAVQVAHVAGPVHLEEHPAPAGLVASRRQPRRASGAEDLDRQHAQGA